MFSKYDLVTMKEVLAKDIAQRWIQREREGLTQEQIKAQLGGLTDILTKINIELVKQDAKIYSY